MTDEIRPEDRLSPTRIRELLERATPGPWDGELPEDFTPTISEREANIELAAILPDIVADWLRMRSDLVDFRAALQDGATNPELTSIDHSWCEAARDGIDRILSGETNG